MRHVKLTPRTLLARSGCETHRGKAGATEASQGTLGLGGFCGRGAAGAGAGTGARAGAGAGAGGAGAGAGGAGAGAA